MLSKNVSQFAFISRPRIPLHDPNGHVETSLKETLDACNAILLSEGREAKPKSVLKQQLGYFGIFIVFFEKFLLIFRSSEIFFRGLKTLLGVYWIFFAIA